MRFALDLSPGVVSEDTDFANPGWTDSRGVRFHDGKPETVKGFERLTFTVLSGVCRTIFPWSDIAAVQCIAFGLHNGLYVWQNGSEADITPTSDFTPGQIDGTGTAGYGTGAYGIGEYGQPSTTDYFALTWSFGSRFGDLYANPRRQGIFRWDGDLNNPAALLANAPDECIFMVCAWTNQVMAFGCTDVGGDFNPSLIRISDADDPSIWDPDTDNTAQQYLIDGRIVAARQAGSVILVWTDAELWAGTYSGQWTFERVGPGGLCGPNAAIVRGGAAAWIGPDLQFYRYALGGYPEILPCPIRDDFAQHAALGQNDKIHVSSVSERDELVWVYADDRDGFECSRALRLNKAAWAPDILTRTAMVDAGPTPSPIGVTLEGAIYWQERGATSDGGPLTASIQSGAQYLDEGGRAMMVRSFQPDFKDQIGPIRLVIGTKLYPQDPEWQETAYMVSPADVKVDMRQTGRLIRARLEGHSMPMSWRLGRLVFDVQPTGAR